MSQPSVAYFYARDNWWFSQENVFKLGVCTCIKDRNNTYLTGEVRQGTFVYVIQIAHEDMHRVDRYLKTKLASYHVYAEGGTEFYRRDSIENGRIEHDLTLINVMYKVLTREEIDAITRTSRDHSDTTSELADAFQDQIHIHDATSIHIRAHIQAHAHQQVVLDSVSSFYQHHDIGKLVWACGLGKALLGILIVDVMKFKTILIGVPSVYLQKQMKNEILKVYPDKANVLFVGGEDADGISASADPERMHALFKRSTRAPIFVVTTYHSCNVVFNQKIEFDFKIGDEAHHLVGMDTDSNGFRVFHKIKSTKTLFMTATEKTIANSQSQDEHVYSMDDKLTFGEIMNCKTVHWAIENNKICDYGILVLKNTEYEVNRIIDQFGLAIEKKSVFISCYMCMKSMDRYEDLTHILLYTNATEDAELSQRYIETLCALNIFAFLKHGFYNRALHSKNCNNSQVEVNEFKSAPRGIISCVYMFGEGFDLPKLNGVCIAGNMKSETRIVQYILRPNRLEKENPNKKAYVIIPYIDFDDDLMKPNDSYEKIRIVVKQLRNVDENVEHKIKVSKLMSLKPHENGLKPNDPMGDTSDTCYDDCIFEENKLELHALKLKLRRSKSLCSSQITNQDEYDDVRTLNMQMELATKENYFDSKSNHDCYIESPELHFKNKGVWQNWYHFLGRETDQYVHTKEEWLDFCKEHHITTVEQYKEACNVHACLPTEPVDLYMDFGNITSELLCVRRQR